MIFLPRIASEQDLDALRQGCYDLLVSARRDYQERLADLEAEFYRRRIEAEYWHLEIMEGIYNRECDEIYREGLEHLC